MIILFWLTALSDLELMTDTEANVLWDKIVIRRDVNTICILTVDGWMEPCSNPYSHKLYKDIHN